MRPTDLGRAARRVAFVGLHWAETAVGMADGRASRAGIPRSKRTLHSDRVLCCCTARVPLFGIPLPPTRGEGAHVEDAQPSDVVNFPVLRRDLGIWANAHECVSASVCAVQVAHALSSSTVT